MPEEKKVISASRRTDIPAFYMPWMMDRLEAGFVETSNPFNSRKTIVDLRPESVHCLVFWSKNYGPFLSGGYPELISSKGYKMFFQFTVNSPSKILEPFVPSIEKRLGQIVELSSIHGPEAIEWRFDPICFFMEKKDSSIKNNLEGFSEIASFMSRNGLRRCVTSFLDIYAKLGKKESVSGVKFIEPDMDTRIETVEKMLKILSCFGMKLRLCCEKGLMGKLSGLPGLEIKSGCIDSVLLSEIHGGNPSPRLDRGQRIAEGCICTESKDIGSYKTQRCHHGCLYCYAS